MNRREKGAYYEKKAAQYLEEQGYEILKRNYRCRIGEIDIIARDAEYLVFVEVKYRRDSQRGDPAEAVHLEKQRTISRTALYYLMQEYGSVEILCRFDVVSILGGDICVIKNAFEYR